MPQLKFRGVECKEICKISKEMIDELENLLECPRSYFTVEIINSTFVRDGEVVDGYPFVEILWFDRGQKIQDETARIITKYVHNAGYENVDIMFVGILEKDYYENGEHF